MGVCPFPRRCPVCPHWDTHAARNPGTGSNHRTSGTTVQGTDFYKMPSRTWTRQPHLPSGQGSAKYRPESGWAHPALSSSSLVTLLRPLSSPSPVPGEFGTQSLGHTSWRCSPSPSPQGPPSHLLVSTPPHRGTKLASMAHTGTAAGLPSQPVSIPGRPRPAWVLGRGSCITGSTESRTPGEPGQNTTQPCGLQHIDPTHLPL